MIGQEEIERYMPHDNGDIILFNRKHYPVMTAALGCWYEVLDVTATLNLTSDRIAKKAPIGTEGYL